MSKLYEENVLSRYLFEDLQAKFHNLLESVTFAYCNLSLALASKRTNKPYPLRRIAKSPLLLDIASTVEVLDRALLDADPNISVRRTGDRPGDIWAARQRQIQALAQDPTNGEYETILMAIIDRLSHMLTNEATGTPFSARDCRDLPIYHDVAAIREVLISMVGSPGPDRAQYDGYKLANSWLQVAKEYVGYRADENLPLWDIDA